MYKHLYSILYNKDRSVVGLYVKQSEEFRFSQYACSTKKTWTVSTGIDMDSYGIDS
jgi:hypothetical protein